MLLFRLAVLRALLIELERSYQRRVLFGCERHLRSLFTRSSGAQRKILSGSTVTRSVSGSAVEGFSAAANAHC